MRNFNTLLTLGFATLLWIGCAETTETETADDTTNTEAEAGTTDQTAVPQPAQPAAAPTGTPAGNVALNPPHGEPGHDCAIPVGQPLDGSGGTVQQPAQPAASPQPVTQPATQTSLPAGTPNPPHGEPGHDCAVAVGAPLPAK